MLAAFGAVVVLAILGFFLIGHGLSGSDSAGSTVIPQTITPSIGTSAPVSGSGSAPTVSSVVSFGPGLVLTATQHVAFNEPVHALTVTVPEETTQVGGGMFSPRIGNLQVLIPGHEPINVSAPLRPGSDVTIPLGTEVTSLDLAYVAYGAVHLSEPSSTQRAAALVTTLSVAPTAGINTVTIKGHNVTNIGCFAMDGTAQSCGTQLADGWSVMRTSGDPDIAIIAQLDL
jgi:hypothetical protein